MIKKTIKIAEPVLESDYQGALNLVEENLFKNNLSLEILQSRSVGEILIAKDGDRIVGMIETRRPGRIFDSIDEKYVSINKIKAGKEEIGFISLVVVSTDCRGNGIGKLLVKKALEQQKAWGGKCVGTFAWQSSPEGGSQKLFESCGFVSLTLHKEPWRDYSEKVGPEGYSCVVCGNPCKCDYLEMVKYL